MKKRSAFRAVRIKSAVLAAAIAFLQVAASVLVLSSPLYVSAGEQLGENDFDSGKGLPWHICESATGRMDFEIEDGVYRITILNPGGASNGGEDRWDCQFRHRGLTIVAGHTYHVHYEIRASVAGKYYTKIGNLAGDQEVWHNMSNGYDLDATWDPIWINANEWKVVDLDFTPSSSIDVAEWAFHLGGDGQYTQGVCFPAGTVIEFDNMSLVDKTDDSHDYVHEAPFERHAILVNQIGYIPGMKKTAVLLSDSVNPVSFSVFRSTSSGSGTGDKEQYECVYNGESAVFGNDPDSGDHVHILDFSAVDEQGEYLISAPDGAESRLFSIGISADYSSMLYDSLNYFYQNRSAIDIQSEYISSGDAASLARRAGHVSDVASVLNVWGYSGTSGTAEVTGGWYDAGDHGKYVVNGGISVWILQNMYELALATGMESAFLDGCLLIPENSNTYPDLLDEARWEMEWMLRMQISGGEYDGMVYHKVTDEKWTGLAVAPADDPQPRVLYPPTTAATLNLAACAAQSARLWRGMDDAFADECLTAAKRSYEAAQAHPEMYAPMEDTPGGGAYGDDNAEDEFYWAACELFITTGEDRYLDDAKKSPFYLKVLTELSGGESVDTFGSFDWGHTATLGTLSLLFAQNNAPASDLAQAQASLEEAAGVFVSMENRQGYGLPYGSSTLSSSDSSSGYLWGSNSFVLDNAIVLACAYLKTYDEDYLNATISAMDYILGRNANDYSYVTGYGTHSAMYPHHRFWANLIDDSFPMAPAGVLVGGPNSGMQDPWVRGMGWKKGTIPPAKCYLDHIEAYSANECAINWNAPLAWVTAFVAGNTEGIIPGLHGLSGTNEGTAFPASSGSAVSAGSAQVQDPSGQNASPVVATTASGNVPALAGNSGTGYGSGNDAGGENMAGVLKAAIIVFGVVAVVIPTEIFIYKLVKLKKDDKK
ncbi:MAG: glycoside hydrolase family 9 protein [Lachnospiraceae bacterium]|nr:glycoside hydrolase family 9 protein [Lachnospiraceae bacterium]